MDPLGIIGLADDPALELLNTTAVPVPGQVLELIGDGRAYLDWLTRAGLIDHRDLSAIRDVFGPAELDAAAVVARDLREDLRRLVAAWTAGPSAAIPPETVSRLNTLLEADHRFARLDACARGVELRDRRRWTHAAQLLVPPAGAWARLSPAATRQWSASARAARSGSTTAPRPTAAAGAPWPFAATGPKPAATASLSLAGKPGMPAWLTGERSRLPRA